jgi:lysine-specific demethylase 8
VEHTDPDAHPLFLQAKYTETILAPGDMLFIPKSHWHYVRSLSTSVSINFWF